ncbi:MAG: hypothetical protein ACN6PR_29150, partial [Achromobacter sp.]
TTIGDRIENVYNTGTKYFHANSTGADSQATGQDSVAIGMGAVASHDGSVALGAGSVASGATLGNEAYLVGGTAKGEVNVGDRRITGLSAGAEDTDAVNVAQLKQVATDSTADAVKYDNSTHNTVTMTGDTYNSTTKTGGTKITNVARGEGDSDAVNMSQLNETNTKVTNVDNRVTNVDNRVTGLENDALLWDPAADGGKGAYNANHGGTGPNKITNVAAADLSDTSTDAVNGSQLKATNDQVTSIDNRVTNVEGDVTTIGDRIENVYNTGTKYFHANSTGADSQATGQDSVAIGMGAVASHDGSVALGAGSVASGATLGNEAYLVGGTAKGEVNVGDRRITGLSAGAEDT